MIERVYFTGNKPGIGIEKKTADKKGPWLLTGCKRQ